MWQIAGLGLRPWTLASSLGIEGDSRQQQFQVFSVYMKGREHPLCHGPPLPGIVLGAGEVVQLVKKLPCKPEGLRFSPQNRHDKKKPAVVVAHICNPAPGTLDRWSPGAHCLVSTAHLASSTGMRDLVSETEVEDVRGMAPQGDVWLLRVSAHTCAPSHMYTHTDTKSWKLHQDGARV